VPRLAPCDSGASSLLTTEGEEEEICPSLRGIICRSRSFTEGVAMPGGSDGSDAWSQTTVVGGDA
jgi:hypothetical protein